MSELGRTGGTGSESGRRGSGHGRFRYEVSTVGHCSRVISGYHHHRQTHSSRCYSRDSSKSSSAQNGNGSSSQNMRSRSSYAASGNGGSVASAGGSGGGPTSGTTNTPGGRGNSVTRRRLPLRWCSRGGQRKRARSRSTNSLLTDYTSNSTIHGVKYLGGPERPWPERLWWGVSFLVSISVCTALIMNTYNKWTQDPVIVSFSQMATPVWRIPFPAVTICPTNIVRQSQFNFTDIMTKVQDKDRRLNLTANELKQLQALSLVCFEYNFKHYEKIPHFMTDFADENCHDLLTHLAPSDDEIFDMFFWKKNNNTYISHTFTEVGLCYTFNLMSRDRIFRDDVNYTIVPNENIRNLTEFDWSPEKGFKKTDTINGYPLRTVVGGTKNTLELGLTTHPKDYDFLCEGPFQGYNIIIHTPVEVPTTINGYIRIPSNQETVIMLKPNMLRTNQALRTYDPIGGRQCYYETERYLRFFRVYTQRNCEMECITNYTVTKCGCSAFYLPRLPGTKICGPRKKMCYKDALEELSSIAVDGVRDGDVPDGLPTCNCLPSCTSLSYDAEISYGDIGFKDYHRTKTYFASGTKHNVSYAYIMLFFKEDQFIALKRAELFGITDFIANCGGLLGLFMGVSLLSIVEIIYFCTLRWIYRIKGQKKDQQQLQMQQQQQRQNHQHPVHRDQLIFDGNDRMQQPSQSDFGGTSMATGTMQRHRY